MSNFAFLVVQLAHSPFANSSIEAEEAFSISPAMYAVGCRKAL